MSRPNFITSTKEKKCLPPKKEPFILFKPQNLMKENSSLSIKIPDNLLLQSIEKEKPELDNDIPLYADNKNSCPVINSKNNNIPNYPIFKNNSNNISNGKFIFIFNEIYYNYRK